VLKIATKLDVLSKVTELNNLLGQKWRISIKNISKIERIWQCWRNQLRIFFWRK